jgi:hypothetical protein
LEAIMAVGEWDQRQLCSDGSCVGVIGPDGTCKVCGRAAQNWGDERKRGLLEPADEPADDALAAADEVAAEGGEDHDEEDDDDLDDDDLDDDHDLDEGEDEDDGHDDLDDEHAAPLAASASASLPTLPAEWGTRLLCPDGSCIGLIGADGRCKVCGRAAVGGPAASTEDGSAAANGEPPAAPAGFTIVTTEGAVTTTDDAVQTTASTVKDGEPALSPSEAPADPDSKEPAR